VQIGVAATWAVAAMASAHPGPGAKPRLGGGRASVEALIATKLLARAERETAKQKLKTDSLA
jgi:hypothetical protein